MLCRGTQRIEITGAEKRVPPPQKKRNVCYKVHCKGLEKICAYGKCSYVTKQSD